MKLKMVLGIALSTLMILWSCATGYGPKKLAGGYTEKPISENTIQVAFEGNQYSTRDEVRTYLTYRCSEVTLEYGYTHFMIIQDNSFNQNAKVDYADSDITVSTTSSMSGGINTSVTNSFDVNPTNTNIVGVFTIQMMPRADPVYAAASIEAKTFIAANEHLIKRKK